MRRVPSPPTTPGQLNSVINYSVGIAEGKNKVIEGYLNWYCNKIYNSVGNVHMDSVWLFYVRMVKQFVNVQRNAGRVFLSLRLDTRFIF